MKIYTIAYSKRKNSGESTLRLYSFYDLNDAIEYYNINKDQLEIECFDIVKHWYSLEEDFLTFESMYARDYINYEENNTKGDIFIKRLAFKVRGLQHNLSIIQHEIMKFDN